MISRMDLYYEHSSISNDYMPYNISEGFTFDLLLRKVPRYREVNAKGLYLFFI